MRPRIFSLLIFILLGLLTPATLWAAACCGGGLATPSLIVGDDQAQVTASLTHSQITNDVDNDGIWYPRSQTEASETFRLEGAHIAWDRFQFGGSIPVIRRERATRAASGLGDISATAGYEYLPEWDYSAWRPRGLGFLQITAPTGRSVNESTAAYQLDARGRGFWSFGIGTILTKTISQFDLFTTLDLHRSLAHDYRNEQSRGTLHPGWGGNFGLGGGYNFAKLRLGAALTWTYEDGVNVTGDHTSTGSPQRFASALLSVGYLFNREWSAIVTYGDQSWFGDPNNTSLGRAAALLLQKRWER